MARPVRDNPENLCCPSTVAGKPLTANPFLFFFCENGYCNSHIETRRYQKEPARRERGTPPQGGPPTPFARRQGNSKATRALFYFSFCRKSRQNQSQPRLISTVSELLSVASSTIEAKYFLLQARILVDQLLISFSVLS